MRTAESEPGAKAPAGLDTVRLPGPKDQALPGGPAWLQNGFHLYLRGYLRRHFHALRLSGHPPLRRPEGPPRVIFVNHPSWWDPLTGLALSRMLFPGVQFCAPIDAVQLQRYGIFKKLGFFPVEQGTTQGALSFLNQSRNIIDSHPKAMLWLTPQGRFADVRQRPVFFQDGLGHLARRQRHAHYQPLAVEYTFWNDRLPEILVRFGSPVTGEDLPPVSAGTEAHGRALAKALETTQNELAADAGERDPRRFQTLLSGRSGVGGLYDVWRKWRARSRGESFRADHDDVSQP